MDTRKLGSIGSHMPNVEKMPVLFLGHGSPMNGIETNEFTEKWTQLGQIIAKPTAVICVSAHWLTSGTSITAMNSPETIHDFRGFPKELFEVNYPAPGDPALAAETRNLVKKTNVTLDHDWGLDHGTWSVVKKMYPAANIPVLQLSIDYHKPAAYHYELAAELSKLRKRGVLIIGSGNMVHNLRMISWEHANQPEYGYDWALALNDKFKQLIIKGDHAPLINYEQLGSAANCAIPTPDHYYPLLYTLGLQDKGDEIEIFNDKAVMGSLTMASVKIG